VGRPHPMVSAPPKSQAVAQSRAPSQGASAQPAGKSGSRRGRGPTNQKGAKQA